MICLASRYRKGWMSCRLTSNGNISPQRHREHRVFIFFPDRETAIRERMLLDVKNRPAYLSQSRMVNSIIWTLCREAADGIALPSSPPPRQDDLLYKLMVGLRQSNKNRILGALCASVVNNNSYKLFTISSGMSALVYTF